MDIKKYIKEQYDISLDDDYNDILPKLTDLFIHNIIDTECHNSTYINAIGLYYKYVKKDYEKTKEYYLMAIELKNSKAMNNLGYYYQGVEKDYEKMKEYYLMAIELKNSWAMINLGNYYQDIEINYEKMKEYYLMAIELKNSSAMFSLGTYYQDVEKDIMSISEIHNIRPWQVVSVLVRHKVISKRDDSRGYDKYKETDEYKSKIKE